MSHVFQGIDPFAVTPPNAGYGQWTDGISTDDGDDRDAASANLCAEAAINRTNYIRYRYINQLEGGIYTSTAPISLANPWTTSNRIVRVGTAAWEGYRAPVTLNGNGSGNVTMTDADTFVVTQTTDGADHTFTFVPPASNVPALYRFWVRQEVNGTSWAANGKVRFNLVGTKYVIQFALTPTGPSSGAAALLEYVAATGRFAVLVTQNNVLVDQT